MVQMALGSLRAALKPVLYGVVALNQFITTLVLIILLIGVYDFGLQGVFGSFLLANLATNILLIPIMRRRISWRFNWEAAKPVINFAITLIPLSLASLVLSSSDRYFLNYFSGLATLGVYGLTYRIGNGAAMLVAVPFTTAWPATIYAEKDSKRIGELVSEAALSLLTVGLLFIVMVSSASKPLLLLFGGNNYIEGANLIPMIAAGAIFFAEAGIFFTALVAHGFLRRQMYSLLGVSALALALNSFFIPTYGIVGAALATLLTYTLALGLSVLMAGRVVPLNCQISKRIKILLSAVVAIILGKLMQDSSASVVVNLLSASLISVLTYVFLLVIFRIIRLREWNLLKLRQSYAKLF
jgi:O-antigen/teichoic acid export membrane protein